MLRICGATRRASSIVFSGLLSLLLVGGVAGSAAAAPDPLAAPRQPAMERALERTLQLAMRRQAPSPAAPPASAPAKAPATGAPAKAPSVPAAPAPVAAPGPASSGAPVAPSIPQAPTAPVTPTQSIPPVPAPPPPADPTAATSISAWAGQATITSLAELLTSTVANAPELAQAELDVSIAEARILEASARDDWRADAELEVSYSHADSQGLDSRLGVVANGSLTRLLPTGGSFSIGGQVDYNRTRPGVLSTYDWTDSVTATLTQPLMRGRGRDNAYYGVNRAILQRDAARLSRQVSAISVVQSVIAAYWDLVLAEQEVAIAEASLGLAEERLRLTKAGIKGGKVADAEALAVEQAIATRTEELLAAELAIVDRSIVLRRATGLPIGNDQLVLRVDAAVGPDDRGWTLGSLLDAAYAASPELARLAFDQKTTELDIEVTKDGLLPQLDAALTLGASGSDDSAGTALKNLATVDDYQIIGKLTYQQSFGARDVRGRLLAAQGQLEKIRVTGADIKQQLAQGLSRAIGNLELAKRRVALAERTIELAQRNIEVELTRFGLGKSTNFDVLQRQDELKQARLRRVRALIDWRKAEGTVMALTGELLPFYGIKLAEK